MRRKSSVVSAKLASDIVSSKGKDNESEVTAVPAERSWSLRKAQATPKMWMNFDDFCTCFSSIIVFHNPHGYQHAQTHTEIKFTPYQPPIVASSQKDRKKESLQPVVPQIPNLPEDKSTQYLFVENSCDTSDKNIELLISLSSLSRWYDAAYTDVAVPAEKVSRGVSVSIEKPTVDASTIKPPLSQKEILPQAGSLIAEMYSWKSVSQGQPILRLHTTTTKAAFLTLQPGRYVLKLINTCPFAYSIRVLSDTNDVTLGDEEQLLNKLGSVPEDAETLVRAEEFFLALDDSVQNFHLIDQETNRVYDLLRVYSQYAPTSLQRPYDAFLRAFHQALYATLRTVLSASGSSTNADVQFAWRCYTNDLSTPDILAAYEPKRPSAPSAGRHSARTAGSSSVSTTGKRTSVGKDKSVDEKGTSKQQSSASRNSPQTDEAVPELLAREATADEMQSVTSIQKAARGYLQRRLMLARTSGTEKNLQTQRLLQSTMATLKAEPMKAASILFRYLLSFEPRLVQCFPFRDDDWNMVSYRDYTGVYPEQPANSWFVVFRDIFYVTTENLVAAKFLSHVPDSILRVVNNDTYEEVPHVFNRLAPATFAKNKNGYTFVAEGMSTDQPLPSGRFRLRLITSYTPLPEIRTEQMVSTFFTKEISDYYIPNREQVICRYRVIVADDVNQTGRGFHPASIRFQTSKPDVLMRLAVLDGREEILRVEGKGCVVVPSVLFMRDVTNAVQPPPPPPPAAPTTSQRQQSPTKSSTKAGAGSRKRDSNRGSTGDTASMSSTARDILRPTSGSEVAKPVVEEKSHKYIIQVTLLYKSWPLTATQWQYVEQLREQERNELKVSNPQPVPPKTEESPTASAAPKRTAPSSTTASSSSSKARSSTGSVKGNPPASARPSTAKVSADKAIDKSKAHWTLQVISDADKADELTIKKDTERRDELISIKKAWETLQAGRAEKARQTRQKFLDSLQLKSDTRPPSASTAVHTDLHSGDEMSSIVFSSVIEQPSATSRKVSTSTKKSSVKDEPTPPVPPPKPPIDEPFLSEPPSKPKLSLPSLDLKPFLKQKLLSYGPVVADAFFEQADRDRRQKSFLDHSKRMHDIRLEQKTDQHNRYREKLRQLDEYVDLQAKIDAARRTTDASREAFRQRFLQSERKRLEELAVLEEKLTKPKPTAPATRKKGSAGKKTAKQ